MLKLCENGSNTDYLYETSSVLRKATETENFGLDLLASVRIFKNRNQTEIWFLHIPNLEKEFWRVGLRYSWKKMEAAAQDITGLSVVYDPLSMS